MATTDEYERYYAERLWAMIPEVHRFEDSTGDRPGVLRQIVEVIAVDAARARRSIDRLWEDQHIETADDWAVAYLGDLVGTRMLPALDSRGRRVDVARTVHFRRRRGTPGLLEGLVREISGWDTLLVEAFRRLARTPHRLDHFPVALGTHTRTPRAGTADLSSARSAELTGGPFEEFFRTPDARQLRGERGRFNLGKVNFHLFRHQAYVLSGVTPATMNDPGPVTHTFDPSGRDVPLFVVGRPPERLGNCGPPWSHSSLDRLPASEIDGGSANDADCDPRCIGAEEWQVSQVMRCRFYSHAAFLVEDGDVEQVAQSGAATVTDVEAVAQLVGFVVIGEPRLRELLQQQGVNFDPTPTWYSLLLELAVTADSGSLRLSDEGRGSVVFEDVGSSAAVPFHETTGANLGSRACHPVPGHDDVRVLVHPELGRFAFPQAQFSPSTGGDPNPGGPDPQSTGIVLYAQTGPVSIGDRVTTDGGGTFATIASGATGVAEAVRLGVDSRVGDVWAGDDVFFANRAQVNGFVKTAGTITSQDPTSDITDTANTEENASVDLSHLAALLDFTVSFPAHNDVDHTVESGELALTPGSYRNVTVRAGATLRVTAGNYFFEQLLLDSSANLLVDASAGKVYLFVSSSLTHRAVTSFVVGAAADMFFVVMTSSVFLDSPNTHHGIVVAPLADLALHQTRSLVGSFFAQTISTQPDQVLTLVPWDGTLPVVEYNSSTTQVPSPSLVVGGSGNDYSVSISLPTGVTPEQVALFADGGALSVDGAIVEGENGTGAVVGTAAAPVTIGVDSAVEAVWSGGDIIVASNALVDGDATATGVINNSGTITGTQSTSGFSTSEVLTFQVVFAGGADTTIVADETVELAAGDYGSVHVQAGGTLLLSGGHVRLTELTLDVGAFLDLDLMSPAQLSVQNLLELNGTIRVVWGNPANFQLDYFGASLTLTKPFWGRLVAPAAQLTLQPLTEGQYRGSFFAAAATLNGSVLLSADADLVLTPRLHAIGLAGPIGALPVPRVLQEGTQEETGGGTISLNSGQTGLTLKDNQTYRLLLSASASEHLLLLQGQERPYLLLEGDGTDVAHFLRDASEPARLEILGVWLGSLYDSRSDVVIGSGVGGDTEQPDWDEVVIRQSTLDPGGVRADGSSVAALRLVIRSKIRRLVIDRSIVGPIHVDTANGGELEQLCVVDSIIDGRRAEPDSQGRVRAISSSTGEVRMNGVSVLGDVFAELLVASDCIVTGGLFVANTQASCFRYGATSLAELPLDDGKPRAPKFYRIANLERVEPHFFVSRRFGDPGYMQLSEAAPLEVRDGAESGSEMGAFSFTLRPIHLASVQSKVEEFQPVGVVPQYITEGEQPFITVPSNAE